MSIKTRPEVEKYYIIIIIIYFTLFIDPKLGMSVDVFSIEGERGRVVARPRPLLHPCVRFAS